MPAEPVPVSPAPDLAGEVEAAPPEAAAPIETPDQAPAEVDTPAAAPEPVYSNGSTSELVIDHFIDTEGTDQSMNQIKAALPHIDPNTVESAVRRLYERGRLLRISPGIYRLWPEPAEPVKPKPVEPAPVRSDADQQRLDALEADRQRKRRERQQDRAAALARQAEADAALRDKLIAACRHGIRDNSRPALVADDLGPVKALLALGVPLDRVLLAVGWRSENEVLMSWTDERLLKKSWEYFGRFDIVPFLMRVRKAPGKPAGALEAPAGTPELAAAETGPASSASSSFRRGHASA